MTAVLLKSMSLVKVEQIILQTFQTLVNVWRATCHPIQNNKQTHCHPTGHTRTKTHRHTRNSLWWNQLGHLFVLFGFLILDVKPHHPWACWMSNILKPWHFNTQRTHTHTLHWLPRCGTTTSNTNTTTTYLGFPSQMVILGHIYFPSFPYMLQRDSAAALSKPASPEA